VSDAIEIMFVDGAKSWPPMVRLLAETGPSFITNETLVVCQDYKYWGAYWLPIIVELLHERLRIVHVLPENTLTFRVDAPIRGNEMPSHLDELGEDAGLQALPRRVTGSARWVILSARSSCNCAPSDSFTTSATSNACARRSAMSSGGGRCGKGRGSSRQCASG
jgi:hypothetical protein